MLNQFLNPVPTPYKWDRFSAGLLPGLVLPLLAFVFFYLMQMKGMSWNYYMRTALSPDIFAKILSFGCIANLALFFLLINRNYYNAARGVIAATILYAVPVVFIKFIL